MSRALLVTLFMALGGCGTIYSASRPAAYFAAASQGGAGTNASLFAADAEVLSDAEIERILSYEYNPPALSRVALLPFGWNEWRGWSEELAVSAAAVDSEVLQTLGASARVYDASFLPSILIPEQRTVPRLREAAARYQADLLLAFRSSCASFQRYRLLQSERTRAYCTVEAVLLDVRTGLVPFVVASTQNFEAEEAENDLNFQETVLRAQLNALGTALGNVASAVRSFVESSGSDV